MNIVLFGFMGSGKTLVGTLVAQCLGWPFLDTDDVIEQREGCSISSIFATRGEPCFRALEHELVLELAQLDEHVISTGGGVVLNPDHVGYFEKNALCVCLQATAETVLARVESQSHRPLLEQQDKVKQIQKLLADRKEFYEAVPHQISVDALMPQEIADRIVSLMTEG